MTNGKSTLLLNLTFLALLSVFAYYLLNMMTHRFEEGSVFPAYSSQRSDPIGTRAYFESLNRMPGLQVKKNFEDWDMLRKLEPGALFIFGIRDFKAFLTMREHQVLRDLVEQGWRLVVSCHSGTSQVSDTSFSSFRNLPWLLAIQSIEMRREASRFDENDELSLYQASLSDGPDGLPESLENQSGLVFHNVPRTWRVVYHIGNQPTVIETNIGQGSLVLLSDSYIFSNEALWRSPQPEFLLWLKGKHQQVFFDELVHGSRVDTDLANLIGQLRLHGFFVGFLLVIVLLLWRWGWPLVPPQVSAATLQAQGRDTASGLVQLLMKAVPLKKLLVICHREWREHMPTLDRHDSEAQAEIEQWVNQSSAGESIRTYQAIHQRLYARRKRW